MVTDVTLALSVTPGAPATGLTRVGVDVEAPGRSAELWRPVDRCRRLHLGPFGPPQRAARLRRALAPPSVYPLTQNGVLLLAHWAPRARGGTPNERRASTGCLTMLAGGEEGADGGDADNAGGTSQRAGHGQSDSIHNGEAANTPLPGPAVETVDNLDTVDVESWSRSPSMAASAVHCRIVRCIHSLRRPT